MTRSRSSDQAGRLEHRAPARVQRQDERELGRDAAEHGDDSRGLGRVVDVGRPVQRRDGVRPGSPSRARDRPPSRTGRGLPSSVSIIGLPTKWMRSAATPSGRGCRRPRAGDEEQVGQQVGDAPVDLLGHRVVEAAQAGLDVRDRAQRLGRDQRGGQRRVHVAVDDHERRSDGRERALERDHQRRRLARLGARPDAEVDVGRGQPEVAEEHVGHGRVVVLAGVDEPLVRAPRPERRDDGRGLHEVGPRADDVYDGVAHVAEYACPPGRARPRVG